jgi:hypothetical protein
MIELFEGDSSETLTCSVVVGGVTVADLTGYEGTFSVIPAIGAVPIITKPMSVVGNQFRVSLTPEESILLIGTHMYIGVMEVTNESIDYNKEVHVNLYVKKQGAV